MHSDLGMHLRGKFPHVLSQGNRYMMVLAHIDSDSIWVDSMKNRTEWEMMLARRRALQQVHAVGITPKRKVLDNKTSMEYRQEIMATGMTYQLVPPDDHRRNISNKKTQMGEYQFIVVCSGVSTNFPMHLWCSLIPQAEKKLLLLRKSNVNPNISALAYLYGPHNYNRQPFVPIGM